MRILPASRPWRRRSVPTGTMVSIRCGFFLPRDRFSIHSTWMDTVSIRCGFFLPRDSRDLRCHHRHPQFQSDADSSCLATRPGANPRSHSPVSIRCGFFLPRDFDQPTWPRHYY
jgi:hypothetical protein